MDPITMMLLAKGVAGAAKAGYGAWQKRQGNQALAAAYEAPTGTPSEYADLIKQARASEISKRRIDEINRTMATSTAALQQAGSRGVIGGIGAVTASGAGAKTTALTQQQSEIMQAMTRATMGAENQRQRDVNRQLREENLAMNAISAGQENISGGLSDVLEAGVQFQGAKSEGLIGKKTSGVKTKKSSGPSMFYQPEQAMSQTGTSATSGVGIPEGSMMLDEVVVAPKVTDEEVLGELEIQPGMKTMKKGGVQKTPGKFSHKENPIHIMKDGAKIGEMTGGEYIFNPSQAKSMQKLAKSGNSDLHKFVRSLLNKPQFK
jgi:hypothetical protein